MSLVEDREATSTTSTSEIRRGTDDQWWWMAFVTAIAMIALAMSIVSFALYATKDSGSSGGGDTAAAPAAALTISAKEFAFAPKTVTAKAGTDVVVTLNNAGAVQHEWTVLKAGTKISKEADFNDSLVALKVGPADAGKSATGTANLAAGVYQVICTIKGHFDAGMAGTLTVS